MSGPRYKLPVPVRFADASLANYQREDRVHARMSDAIEVFLARDDGDAKGIIFAGPPGTGKTRALATVSNAVDAKAGCFVTMAWYERLLRKRMTVERAFTASRPTIETEREYSLTTDLVAYVQERLPVLCLDDLGKEHTTATAWIEDEVDYLLRRRFDLGLPTVISTNIPPSKFAVKYSESMASFIHEAYAMVKADAADQRVL